jgi:hypothetical protein
MPTPTDRSTFRALVADVAARATARLPQDVNGRIESAVKLVLLHDVMPQADGSILVGSSSDPLKVYRLQGTSCECQDFAYGKAPDGWCQHRIAAGIAKRVQELLPPDPASVIPEMVEPWPNNDPNEAAPASPAVPLPSPEPCFSLTLKGLLGGVDAMLTVKAMTASEFTQNLQAVRGLLNAPVAPAAPTQGQEGWCGVHGLQMTWNTGKNGDQGWYSHKVAGKWCKGKGVR